MSTIATTLRPAPVPRVATLRDDPAAQAYLLLRIGLTIFPIVMGLDKFAHVLTDDWARYLATEFNDILPGSAATGMHIIGVVEIVAGLVVAVVPRYGALLVAGWLAGIIVDLLLVGGYGDVAFRDFGLMLTALTLARLATAPRAPVR
jgi:DoxX